MSTASTEPGKTPEATTGSPGSAPAAFTSYEECIAALNSITSNVTDPTVSDVIKNVLTFFNKRVEKTKNATEKDGSGAVKRAIEGKRLFKPYEKRASTDAENKPGGGLFQ